MRLLRAQYMSAINIYFLMRRQRHQFARHFINGCSSCSSSDNIDNRIITGCRNWWPQTRRLREVFTAAPNGKDKGFIAVPQVGENKGVSLGRVERTVGCTHRSLVERPNQNRYTTSAVAATSRHQRRLSHASSKSTRRQRRRRRHC